MISTSVRIREFYFPSDYEQVFALWGSMERGVRTGRSDTPAEIEKKLARDPDLFLVAEVDRNIIGSVIGGFDGRRGHGIGSRLMDELESRLRAKGCLKCYLLVTADNREAEVYCKHRGWQHMDQIHLYGKDLQCPSGLEF